MKDTKQDLIDQLRNAKIEDVVGNLYDNMVKGVEIKVNRDAVIALIFNMKIGEVDDIPRLIGLHAAYRYLSKKNSGLGPWKNWIQGMDVVYCEILWSWLKMVHDIDAKTYISDREQNETT